MAFDAFLIFRTSDLRLINETADSIFGNLSGKAALPLKSFSLGATINITSGQSGTGAGKVAYNGVTFTKDGSFNSPLLLGACDNGKFLSQVTLALRQTNSVGRLNLTGVFAVYTFANVAISAYNADGSTGDALPTETLHLVAEKYALNTYSVSQLGVVSQAASGWDTTRNISYTPSVIDSPHP